MTIQELEKLVQAKKTFLALTGLILLYVGFMWSFMPDANLTQYSIEIGSILGMNMIKTDIGAPLLGWRYISTATDPIERVSKQAKK